jgi:hypothetical protein
MSKGKRQLCLRLGTVWLSSLHESFPEITGRAGGFRPKV